MKKISDKHLYIVAIFILVLLSNFLSGKIEYWQPKYSGMDQNYYRQMAESSPAINLDIPHFFAHRILPPWLAGLMPGDIVSGFRILNIIFLLIYVYTFYFFLLEFNLNESTAFFLTFAFVFNRYFFQEQAWNYFQLTDIISNTIIFISLIALKRSWYLLIGILFIIGVLSKQTVLVIIPVGFVFLWQSKKDFWKSIPTGKDFLKFGLALIPGVLIFFLIRILIKIPGTEKFFSEVFAELYKYTQPAVWIKTLIIPFLPFSLLPFLFFKEFVNFCKNNLYLLTLLVFVILTAMLGYDFERLMTPAAPAFYAFIGIIFEKMFVQNNLETKIIKYLLAIIVFINSFYHLWGLIKLPNADTTILLSIILLAITTTIFIYLKIKNTKTKYAF